MSRKPAKPPVRKTRTATTARGPAAGQSRQSQRVAPGSRSSAAPTGATSGRRKAAVAAKPAASRTGGAVPQRSVPPVRGASGEMRAMPARALPAAVTPAAVGVPSAVRLVTVDAERSGQRIDNYLLSQLKGVPKSAIYRLLRTGQVRINGGRAKPEAKLAGGDIVRIPPVRVDAPGTPVAPGPSLRNALDQAVVFEDAQILVLNKPSGLASHGGSGVSLGAIEALRALRPQDTLELVHRLDRDTSGLLLFAKKHSALRRLQTLIREGQMQKRYFALIAGSPEREHFEVDVPLHKNQLRGGERMVEVAADGKPSLSRFHVLTRFAGATLVDVEIITGRTHQIRVHALHVGHPLAGDEKYGDADFNKAMRAKGLRRLFLHAHSLSFPWGESALERRFEQPLGDDLSALLTVLRQSAP